MKGRTVPYRAIGATLAAVSIVALSGGCDREPARRAEDDVKAKQESLLDEMDRAKAAAEKKGAAKAVEKGVVPAPPGPAQPAAGGKSKEVTPPPAGEKRPAGG